MDHFLELPEEEQDECIKVKIMLGFIYAGFTNDHYYGECVIILREVMLVLATVFLSTIGPDVQVLVSILILVISLFLQMSHNPYKDEKVNKLEANSILIAIVTQYFGMYYIMGSDSDYI
jgi:hypothetical protein